MKRCLVLISFLCVVLPIALSMQPATTDGVTFVSSDSQSIHFDNEQRRLLASDMIEANVRFEGRECLVDQCPVIRLEHASARTLAIIRTLVAEPDEWQTTALVERLSNQEVLDVILALDHLMCKGRFKDSVLRRFMKDVAHNPAAYAGLPPLVFNCLETSYAHEIFDAAILPYIVVASFPYPAGHIENISGRFVHIDFYGHDEVRRVRDGSLICDTSGRALVRQSGTLLAQGNDDAHVMSIGLTAKLRTLGIQRAVVHLCGQWLVISGFRAGSAQTVTYIFDPERGAQIAGPLRGKFVGANYDGTLLVLTAYRSISIYRTKDGERETGPIGLETLGDDGNINAFLNFDSNMVSIKSYTRDHMFGRPGWGCRWTLYNVHRGMPICHIKNEPHFCADGIICFEEQVDHEQRVVRSRVDCDHQLRRFDATIPGNDPRYSCDGLLVATHTRTYSVLHNSEQMTVYRVSDASVVFGPTEGHCLSFSPDSRYAAIQIFSRWFPTYRGIQMYRTSDWQPVGPVLPGYGVSFSPNGEFVITIEISSRGHTIHAGRVYRIGESEPIIGPCDGEKFEFSTDGQLLIGVEISSFTFYRPATLANVQQKILLLFASRLGRDMTLDQAHRWSGVFETLPDGCKELVRTKTGRFSLGR